MPGLFEQIRQAAATEDQFSRRVSSLRCELRFNRTPRTLRPVLAPVPEKGFHVGSRVAVRALSWFASPRHGAKPKFRIAPEHFYFATSSKNLIAIAAT